MGLKLREMGRSVRGLSSRNIWFHYRCTITLAFLVFVCGEIIIGIMIGSYYAHELSGVNSVLLFLFITIGQLIGGAYFITQGRKLAGPLLGYMESPDSNPRPENEQRVRDFVFWTETSSASMILNTGSSCFFYVALSTGALDPAGPWYYFPTGFVMIVSRVVITLSQVCSLHTNHRPVCTT